MPFEWSPAKAEALARRAGLRELGERHWRVIASAREEAARNGRAPRWRRIQELTGLGDGELRTLFPGDSEALIARIAGCDRPAFAGREAPAGEYQED